MNAWPSTVSLTVYFPGTYQDDLIISGSTPVYFASGIYYFEKKVEITGNAKEDVAIFLHEVPGANVLEDGAILPETADEAGAIA